MADRDKLVEAFLALLAEGPIERIGFARLAVRAGVSLAELRAEFDSTLEVLAAFMRDTDRKVLAGGDPDLADEPARERLFDVLMRRIEILRPHREAVRSLARSARRDPALALALNRMSHRSQKWMLAAAGVDASGVQGDLRAQGLVVVMARTLRVWLDDEDPGLARTMATLDRELAHGERMLNFVGDLCRLIPRFGPRWRARRRPPDNPASSAAA
jgi:AcrR family transcriptional regulator